MKEGSGRGGSDQQRIDRTQTVAAFMHTRMMPLTERRLDGQMDGWGCKGGEENKKLDVWHLFAIPQATWRIRQMSIFFFFWRDSVLLHSRLARNRKEKSSYLKNPDEAIVCKDKGRGGRWR